MTEKMYPRSMNQLYSKIYLGNDIIVIRLTGTADFWLGSLETIVLIS